MTSNNFTQKGCAWYPIRADFSLPFEYEYSVFLGTTDDDGADGMCIVFQPNSPSECGSSGGGIGAQGIRNSWIIEMDTWRNWEPTTMIFRVLLDDKQIISVKYDIVSRIFNNNPLAYWGITASTGGARNQHVLCFENISVVNREPETSYVQEQICQGDSIFIANEYRKIDGIYVDSLKNRGGCDSLVFHELLVNPLDSIFQDTSICQGGQWQGKDKTGIYIEQVRSQLLCDQILVTKLNVLPVYQVEQTLTTCDSLVWDANGVTYTSSGFYRADLKTSEGCDSIVTLNLKVHFPAAANLDVSACDSLFWDENQQWLFKSGLYQRTLKTIQGCDSVRTLQLTLHSGVSFTENATACDAFIWEENNIEYSSSGNYNINYQTIHGCDSVRILSLEIHNSSRADTIVNACDEFAWNQTGVTYSKSGIYEASYNSIYGCDSIVSLVLAISPSYNVEENLSVCDSVRWQQNNELLTQSGLFRAPFQSLQGCDSTHILSLKVHPSYELTTSVRSCDLYIWDETGEVLAESGDYYRELTTAAGCDSVRILNLMLDSTISRTDTVYARENYFWPQTGQTYNEDGTYTNILTASTGCDSIQSIVLKLLGVTYPNILHAGGENNNRFTIFGSSLVREILELGIFDRWGNRVFLKTQLAPNRAEEGWDGLFEGQFVVPGVYVFTAKLLLEGFPTETLTGSITVIR